MNPALEKQSRSGFFSQEIIQALERGDGRLWPWDAEPYRLWSLEEMVRLKAVSVLASWNDIKAAIDGMFCMHMSGEPANHPDMKEMQSALISALEGLDQECRALPISKVFLTQLGRVTGQAKNPVFGVEPLASAVADLLHGLGSALGEHYFLAIPASDRRFYEQRQPIFGTSVHSAFPSSVRDIEAACRCFSLDEATACIFHLMRALEVGLRVFGARVGLDARALSVENWHNIIQQIEKKIRELDGLPRGEEKTESLRTLSEAAAQFRYFKDAWRNHVSHSREHYEKRDAVRTMNAVGEFLTELTKHGIHE